ncbi:hypothetical protein FRX31_029774 [Thalictrum thalictroides]|uniref:Uncharacterized protein n=1 Tax=Thalictrum thalictroides TaxID=46969 RepID=A0A7J6V6C2_THATH|nr:hypothetical protein FRX31_029774 [Thalictrum thalictroides]
MFKLKGDGNNKDNGKVERENPPEDDGKVEVECNASMIIEEATNPHRVEKPSGNLKLRLTLNMKENKGMELPKDLLFYDAKGSDIEVEVYHGYQSDDEERKTLKKDLRQSQVPSSSLL